MINSTKKQIKIKRIIAVLTGVFFLLQPLSSLSLAADDFSGVGGDGNVPTQPALAGDFNGNGVIDAADYVVWRKLASQPDPPLSAVPGTISGSNIGDTANYDAWRANFGSTQLLPGDYNRDGVVDNDDYEGLMKHFGKSVADAERADANGDGVVGTADYVVLRKLGGDMRNWGSYFNTIVDEVRRADLNGDGVVNQTDIEIWTDAMFPPIEFPVTDFSETQAVTPILIPTWPCATDLVQGVCLDFRETTDAEQTLIDRVRINYNLAEAELAEDKTAGFRLDFDWNPSEASYFDATNGVTFGLRSEAEVGEADRFKIVFEDSSGQQAEVEVEGVERNFKAFEITAAMILSANASINLQYMAQIIFIIDLLTTGNSSARGFIELATAGVQYVWNPDLNGVFEIPEHPNVSLYGNQETAALISDPDSDRYEIQFEGGESAGVQMEFVNEIDGILDAASGLVMGFQAEGVSNVTLLLTDEAGRQATVVLSDLTNQFMNYAISPHMVQTRRLPDFDLSRIKSIILLIPSKESESPGHVVISSAKRVPYTGTIGTEPDVPLVIPVYNDAGERLTISAITRAPTNGTVTIASNGMSVIYTPQSGGDPGVDGFQIAGSTSTGGTTSSSVQVKAGPSSFPPSDPTPLPPHDPADPILKEQDILYDSEIELALLPSSFTGADCEPHGLFTCYHWDKFVPLTVLAHGRFVKVSGHITMDRTSTPTGRVEITVTAHLEGNDAPPLKLPLPDSYNFDVVYVTYDRTVVYDYGFWGLGGQDVRSDSGSAKVTHQIQTKASDHDSSYVSDEFNISIGLLTDKEENKATHKWRVDHRHEEKTKKSAPDGSNPESRDARWTVRYQFGIPYTKFGYEGEESETKGPRATYTKYENKAWTDPLEPTYTFYEDELKDRLTGEYEKLTITTKNKYGPPRLNGGQYFYDLEEEKVQIILDTTLGGINSYSDDFEENVYYLVIRIPPQRKKHEKRHYGETMTDEEEKKISRSLLKEEWNLFGFPTSYLLEGSGTTLNSGGIKILDSSTFESRIFVPNSSNIDVIVKRSWQVKYDKDGRPAYIDLSYYNDQDKTAIRDDHLIFWWVYYDYDDPVGGGDFYYITSVRMPAATFPQGNETLLDTLRFWYQMFQNNVPGNYPGIAEWTEAQYAPGASIVQYV